MVLEITNDTLVEVDTLTLLRVLTAEGVTFEICKSKGDDYIRIHSVDPQLVELAEETVQKEDRL